MIRTPVTIINKLGLHARASSRFVATAARFASKVRIVRGGREVDGKSIMAVMTLAVGMGTELELVTDGDDEQAAMDALVALVADRFGEAE